MTTLRPSKLSPPPFQHTTNVTNRQVPDSSAPVKISKNINHLVSFCRKPVLQTNGFPPTDAYGVFRTKFVTGHAPAEANLKLVGSFYVYKQVTANHQITVSLTPEGGATTTVYVEIPNFNEPTAAGITGTAVAKVETSLDIDPNTVYELSVEINDPLYVFSTMFYESLIGALEVGSDGTADPSLFLDSAIDDNNQSKLANSANAAWARGGGPVIAHFTADDGGTASLTEASATWTNPFDSSTSQTSTTTGWITQLNYHNQLGLEYVRSRGYVYGTDLTADNVRFVTSSGGANTPLTTSGVSYHATTGWTDYDTVQVPVMSPDTKIDLQLRTFGGKTPEIWSIYMHEYDDRV